MFPAVKFNAEPSHTGPLFPATGAEGAGFIVTTVVAGVPAQPFKVAVTEYVPDAAELALATDGFCKVDVNPLGPVHLYVAPATVVAVKFRVLPEHTGLLLPA